MKFKYHIIPLFIFSISINISSQEFDESFLQSLPDDIASDLIKRSETRDSLEKTQYRRPSTFIEKPDPTSNRFGANIFSMMQSSLMPLNEPNFDSSYVLDFGDELDIQLIGQKSSITKLVIKRDGSINIQDIGKLYIAGLSLDEAANIIKKRVSQSFIGVEAYVTLTNVRDIQIIMAGNIFNPGSYTLNGNSNIFHALSVSGGPSENGSFRSIDLIRNSKKIETIDLYQIFIFGKSNFNTRLRSGDIVFVNPVRKVISVSGAISRPGVYELKENEDLSKALFFSNGLTSYADKNNIKLERILDGQIKGIPIANISQFKNINAQDGDRIFIREYPFRIVQINGAVLNPGSYLMNEGDSVSDVVAKAGGITDIAYPFGTVYENKATKKINADAKQKLYEDFLDNILKLSQKTGSENDISSLLLLIKDVKNSEPSGRIVLDINNKFDQSIDTTHIKDGDIITIPEMSDQVYIFGSVSSVGPARYVEGKKIDYYLQKRGGLTEDADKKGIYVLQPNGETVKVSFNKNLFTRQAPNIEIYPGSIIFIPEEIGMEFARRLTAQSYATILGNIGVSLASISVLKD